MHIAIITAGGAGMFCGSCMHDNTWAKSLRQAGAEVTLIPTYTPIRVDEENLSSDRVFLGGINLYLDYQSRIWRRLPRWMTKWLDHPRVISFATRFGVSNDAQQLGELSLAMLDGELGPQRGQIEELAEFIGSELKPDVVCFSNALLAGTVRTIKSRFSGPVFCTLQGDDIFLDSLPERFRSAVIDRMSERCREFDGFLVHSRYYGDFMASLLNLPSDRMHVLPLGIDLVGHDGAADKPASEVTTIGYFARVCPEKGLHLLVDAVRKLRSKHPQVKLVAGGYLGSRDADYFAEVTRSAASLGDAFQYVGSPLDRAGKIELLKRFDVMSIPTTYREPKGISVLEALANGVPVVQPAHGAFVEMLAATGGGLLFQPGDSADLAAQLEELVVDRSSRIELGRRGQAAVRTKFNSEVMAAATLTLLAQALPNQTQSSSHLPEPHETA